MTKVVDASAVAAVMFREEGYEKVVQLLAHTELIAPSLIVYELCNVAWRKVRASPEMHSVCLEALGELPKLGLTLTRSNPVSIYLVARETGLSAYDASYLYLSRQWR